MPIKGILLGGKAAPLCVTGAGLVSAAGRGLAAFEDLLPAKRREDAGHFAASVRSVVPAGGDGEPDSGRESDRAVTFAAMASVEALRASAATAGRLAVHVGTALGGVGAMSFASPQTDQTAAGSRSGLADSAGSLEDLAIDGFATRLASSIRQAAGSLEVARPRCFSVTCVSGLCALEQAAADIALDRADGALVGGVDAAGQFMQAGFRALGALSASGKCRPFDTRHDGIVIGEGAACIVVEPVRRRFARQGAPCPQALGCILSQRLVSDAVHLTTPDAAGRGMAAAVEGVLADAGLAPAEIGAVLVTAVGSPVYDRMLSRALELALGGAAEEVPVTTWEVVTGHALAATGILGIIHALVVLRRGEAHPAGVAESFQPDPECRLRYVIDAPVRLRAPTVLLLTVGFGGQNGATLIAAAPGVAT